MSAAAFVETTITLKSAAIDKLGRIQREVQATAGMAVTKAIRNDTARVVTLCAFLNVDLSSYGFLVVAEEINVLQMEKGG
jgi:hypothetical protein